MGKRNLILISLMLLLANSLAPAAVETEDETFVFANRAFEDKFYEVASAQFESFLKKYPQSNKIAQAYLMLGQCYYHLDKLLPAISALEKVLTKPREINLTDAAYYWLGEIYFKGKDFSTARNYFQKIIDELAESKYKDYSLHSIALTYYETGEFKQALLLWDKLNMQTLSNTLVQDIEFYRGMSHFKLFDYDSAKQNFLSYIQKFPKAISLDEAYYYLGEANFHSADYGQALESYSQVITRFPKSGLIDLARFGIAWTYLKMERFEDADEYFARFISANPKSPILDSAMLGLATGLSKLGKFEEALTSYERLINNFGDSQYIVSAYLGKADCLYNLSRFDETVSLCLEAIKKFSKQDDKDDFFYTLGWAYQKMGRTEDAILTFEDLVHYSDDDTIKSSSLARLGDIYLEKREFRKAQDAYDGILKDYPHSLYADYAQFQLGIIFYKMEKYDAAIMALRSLGVNFPKTRFAQEGQYYIATAYFKGGNFLAAEQEFLKLSGGSSRFAQEANVKRGICMMNSQKYQEAIELFKRVRMSGPSREYLIVVDYYTAWAYYFSGKEKEAIKALTEFIQNYPDSEIVPDIVFWFGEYYYRHKDWNKSQNYFSQILSRYSQDDLIDDAYYWLGWVSYYKKDYLSAVHYFEQMVSNYPGSPLVPDALYRKGVILKEIKLFKEAENVFEQLQEKFSDTHFYYLSLKERAELRRKENDLGTALSLLRMAENSTLTEFNALIKFDIASIFEDTGDLEQALMEYLKIVYLKELKNQSLIDKTNIKIAGILEKQQRWQDAEKIYVRLATSEQPDIRNFAQARLGWIRMKVK